MTFKIVHFIIYGYNKMLNLDDFSEENPTMRSQSVDGVKYLVPPIHPLDVQETQIVNISIEVVEDTHDPTTPVENISIEVVEDIHEPTTPVENISIEVVEDTHDPTTPVENTSIEVVEEHLEMVKKRSVTFVEGTTSPVKSIAKSILKKKINKPKSFIGFQQVHQPVYSNFKFNLNSTKKKSGIFSTMNIISR